MRMASTRRPRSCTTHSEHGDVVGEQPPATLEIAHEDDEAGRNAPSARYRLMSALVPRDGTWTVAIPSVSDRAAVRRPADGGCGITTRDGRRVSRSPGRLTLGSTPRRAAARCAPAGGHHDRAHRSTTNPRTIPRLARGREGQRSTEANYEGRGRAGFATRTRASGVQPGVNRDG